MTTQTLRPANGTTFTVPAGVTSIQIDATGNGGSGGVNTSGQGGGGSGAFSRVNALSVTPGGTLTINWGTVGTPSNASTPIWISKTGSQPASVSQGCLVDSAGAAGNGTTGAGTGGLAANCIGDVKNDGASGALGSIPQSRGGAGATPGTASGPGTAGSGITGVNGAGSGGTVGVNGTDATGDGCGGGGGGPGGGTSGAGKSGFIVLTYTAVVAFPAGFGFGNILGS